MDSLIILMAQHMPVKSVADLIGEHDTRIWRVLEHYVSKARSEEDFSEVESVGVDETSRAKGHNYISVFVDLDKSKVIYVCEGKDANAIKSFKYDLEDHNGLSKNVRHFCCDMSPAFISGVTNNFPNSSITFDKFHVMKLMNQAVDQVRREEQSQNSNLKRTRYIWCHWRSKSVQSWRNKTVHLLISELKLRGCADAGHGGVPRVARFIQPGIEHK